MKEQINLLYVITLWYKPGKTMQDLIKTGGGHFLALIVAMVFGCMQTGRFYLTRVETSFVTVASGLLAGFVGLYLFAWLLRNFGRWFGGQASLREVRVAIGLGLLPWLLLFLALVFTLGTEADPAALASHYWLFFLGFLYGYVILLLSLATALRLSVLKTFLCLIVTFLVSLFPITLLIQMLAPSLH